MFEVMPGAFRNWKPSVILLDGQIIRITLQGDGRPHVYSGEGASVWRVEYPCGRETKGNISTLARELGLDPGNLYDCAVARAGAIGGAIGMITGESRRLVHLPFRGSSHV